MEIIMKKKNTTLPRSANPPFVALIKMKAMLCVVLMFDSPTVEPTRAGTVSAPVLERFLLL